MIIFIAMLNVERLLKRLRAKEEDVECFHYDGTVKKGIRVGAPEFRRFMFFDAWEKGLSTAENQLKKGVAKEMDRNAMLHRIATNAGCVSGLPLDGRTNVKYLLVGGYRFPVYACGEGVPAAPTSMTALLALSNQITPVVKALHDAGFVLWDMNSRAILQHGGGGEFMLSPMAIANMRPATFQGLTSIIKGCTIISPYQIMLDMLCSKYEQAENEIGEFKEKMVKFWTAILVPESKHTPEVCRFYQSLHQGSVDYLDTIICRWCKTRRDDPHNKTYVIKDPKKLLNPVLFKCIDWFAFGVVLDELLEKLLDKDPRLNPPDSFTKTIYDCLCMDEPLPLTPPLASQSSD